MSLNPDSGHGELLDSGKGYFPSLDDQRDRFIDSGQDNPLSTASGERPKLDTFIDDFATDTVAPSAKRERRIQFNIGVEDRHAPRSPDIEEFPFPFTVADEKGKLMVELYDLHGSKEWVETARWIKYEQDVEGVNHHWSLPHVGFLFFDSVFALEKSLKKAVIIESSKQNWSNLIEDVTSKLEAVWNATEAETVAELMRLRQSHVQQHKSLIKSMTSAGLKQLTSSILLSNATVTDTTLRGNPLSLPEDFSKHESEEPLASKLSIVRRQVQEQKLVKESAQVFTGEVSYFDDNRLIFIRLDIPVYFPEVYNGDPVKIDCPARYFVFILGPQQDVPFHQIGRSFCTIMADEASRALSFLPAAKKAKNGTDLVNGLKDFLHNAALISGSKIDSKNLVQSDRLCEELNSRAKLRQKRKTGVYTDIHHDFRSKKLAQKKVTRSTGYFRGFREDFLNRFPHYRSDFTDAFHLQCIRTFIFMFLACITPTVTFGGLMGEYTQESMGMAETLIAQSAVGIIWGLFAAQPLIIQSPTGPVLLFEGALYTACIQLGLDFLSVRLFSGIFMFLYFFLAVCFDVQRVLKYVTKFTEEIFAALIAMILFKEAIHSIAITFSTNPALNFIGYEEAYKSCLLNGTISFTEVSDALIKCEKVPHPNTALLSFMIFIATFVLAIFFHRIKVSQWLGRPVETFVFVICPEFQQRTWVGDYSVLGSLLIIVIFNQLYFPSIYLEKLEMPATLGYTDQERRGHGILVIPSTNNVLLSVLISSIAAGLLFILVFVETGITEVVLARKERKLEKGCGESWDLMLSGVCCLFSSLFGLPWMCAAAVQTLAHSNSLTVNQKKAPGEQPEAVRVIEQRVTTIALSVSIGFFGMIGHIFTFLPMAALFGVFAYLGLTSLLDLDFFERIFLFFKPHKYHPKKAYVDEVKTPRMHLFTAIQTCLVIIAFLLKFNKYSAMLFPFVLCIFVAVRQYLLPKIFANHELEALDEGHSTADDLPQFKALDAHLA